MKKLWIFGLLAGLILVACQSSAPLHQYSKGSLLASYDFSSPGSFEEGAYGAATMQVINGNYEIDVTQGDDTLWWGQWGDSYSDTIIDVDTEQLSDRPENAYGVMCRVRGSVGQPQPTDATLAAIMQEPTSTVPTAEVTSPATAQSTAESTVTATAASTAQSTTVSTAASTAASTAPSTAASTTTSTEQSESGLSGLSFIAASTAQSTAEVTVEASNTATATSTNTATTSTATSTSTATATTAATAAATSPLQLPTPALSPTPPSTLVPANEGDGYLFLIQGGGSFGIFRSSGRNLTPLLDWKTSSAINQGPAQNHMQVICAGNYLAFYVNNQFLGDATDNTYTSGQVGLAASAATRLGTRIVYDNLTVSAAVQSK